MLARPDVARRPIVASGRRAGRRNGRRVSISSPSMPMRKSWKALLDAAFAP
jgi:hypothetical protein